MYTDHTIDDASLNELPKEDLVLEMLYVHDKDGKDINDTSSCVSSQETETDKIPVGSNIS